MVDTTANGSNGGGDLPASFRQKAAFMKTWKPASSPSNRDRLELYALHKQAVSGDAPSSLSTQTAAERAKYQAWRTKSGLAQHEAMRLYIQESDRQIRVYGGTSSSAALGTTTALPAPQTPFGTPAALQDNNYHGGNNGNAPFGRQQPRGLAAIPLLCAAASESRQAYLRRIANTRLEQAWWGRQEPLTAVPGSLFALPESLLIGAAALIERISLTCEAGLAFLPLLPPAEVVQSFLWPIHNVLLAVWMEYILVATAFAAATDLLQTVVWGSRRTGLSLDTVWKDQVAWTAQTAATLTEGHQPLTARLLGLALAPYGILVTVASAAPSGSGVLWQAALYTLLLCTTWWYWLAVLPWLTCCLLGAATVAGGCFALIELAGV